MTREEIYSRLKSIFADVFDREVSLSDETTAADVSGWDSLTHITLIGAIEDEFDIKFSMKDIVQLKNVGAIVSLIMEISK